VKEYLHQIKVEELCVWLRLPRSSFYYKPKDGKRGIAASTHTFKLDGSQVSNEVVSEDIRLLLNQEFVNYGYEKITVSLHNKQYIINKKKVYRMMSEQRLLLGKVIRTSGKREFVKHRKVAAKYPMECICLDIKYIWVEGEKRHYFLLTIMDIYSRKVLCFIFQRSIRKMDVINLFRKLNVEHDIKGVTLRNDNGSQFIANDVKAFLKTIGIKQEFTHIATPEENAYIESFHSTLQRDVIERYEWNSYYEAKTSLERYMKFYNEQYLHRSIGMITPAQKWEQGVAARTVAKQTGIAWPDLSRAMDTIKKSIDNPSPGPTLYKSDSDDYLCDATGLACADMTSTVLDNLSS
jgi:putative transposase